MYALLRSMSSTAEKPRPKPNLRDLKSSQAQLEVHPIVFSYLLHFTPPHPAISSLDLNILCARSNSQHCPSIPQYVIASTNARSSPPSHACKHNPIDMTLRLIVICCTMRSMYARSGPVPDARRKCTAPRTKRNRTRSDVRKIFQAVPQLRKPLQTADPQRQGIRSSLPISRSNL